ncbi:hypothetical protein XBP1_1030002 [Xenorhabdus bovienii str. puntauvense]|uniref:Uncharacterized protein n=1 Tax=Xenorhabdus bovienii str. puntauvense TaxID=1398201 RepID=A0A077NAU1_XENBV|nr:hypothetical protein XBP1_1030002 [Xenorhabdus bovienii str. puntauvense]
MARVLWLKGEICEKILVVFSLMFNIMIYLPKPVRDVANWITDILTSDVSPTGAWIDWVGTLVIFLEDFYAIRNSNSVVSKYRTARIFRENVRVLSLGF